MRTAKNVRMRGLAYRITVALALLTVAACSSDEEVFEAGPVLKRTGHSSVLARAYSNPTAGIGFWRVAPTATGTRVWYGPPSTCPWARS